MVRPQLLHGKPDAAAELFVTGWGGPMTRERFYEIIVAYGKDVYKRQSVDGYIAKLIKKGYRIAICERCV